MTPLAGIVLAFVLVQVEPVPISLEDRFRFPSAAVCKDWLEFNRAYCLHVEARFLCEPARAEHWTVVLAETDRLYAVWDWCHAAVGGEGREEGYWLYSLGRLRRLIGDEAYQAGQLPIAVPVWRFEHVD